MAAKTGNKKRKQKGPRKEKSFQHDQENYFQRLLFSAQKALRKQSKLVRNLESQKIVRKIKERNSDKGSELEVSYQQLKQADLEQVVQESLRRLGILHLDPKLIARAAKNEVSKESVEEEEEGETKGTELALDEAKGAESGDATGTESDEAKDTEADQAENKESTELSPKEKELVEKILKHKKMQSTLEEWNEKVTEYRRWCLQQQEKTMRTPGWDKAEFGRQNKKRKLAKKEAAAAAEEGNKSQFLCLGGENEGEAGGGEESMPQYGPGSFPEEKKKNRMGQRQRKAKQNAIRAKESGRVHLSGESVNWRPKKAYQPSEEEGQPSRHHGGHGQGTVSQSRGNADKSATTEKLHPSWAAAKKETAGIVAFQGKKITF